VSTIAVRPARAEDAQAIADIYNHYILHSTATFHTEAVDASERRGWMTQRGNSFPTWVAEESGVVIGWGALSPYAPRPAWSPTVEVAVYVDPERVGRGAGASLMDALVSDADTLGFHTIVSRIEAGNEPSIALARRSGFREAGRLREAGWKFGKRLDVVIMQLLLDE
jgi:phosphinothricin acetyltransferase